LPASANHFVERTWERQRVSALVCVASALAWLILWLFGHSPALHYSHLAYAEPPLYGSYLFGGFMFVCGWTIMTIAMMLPTSLPLIGIFSRIAQDRADRNLLTALVVLGYLAVWCAFGVLAYGTAIGVRAGFGKTEVADPTNRLLTAGALFVAGAFQFSALKYKCLAKCRSPFSFVVAHWTGKRHRREALRLGIDHGLFCVGCCWALMLLMLVMGVANLALMLLLGVIMAVEKNFRWGSQMVKPVGVLLIAISLMRALYADPPVSASRGLFQIGETSYCSTNHQNPAKP
jgi:predicted metal-binding membrane protein